jgi:hypothetical protein
MKTLTASKRIIENRGKITRVPLIPCKTAPSQPWSICDFFVPPYMAYKYPASTTVLNDELMDIYSWICCKLP